MESTWERRDLPVLDAAVRYVEEHHMKYMPEATDLAEMTGLDPEEVGLALVALRDEYLAVEITGGGLKGAFVRQIYPSARRTVGQWPTPENLAERILVTLEQAAEDEPDEEKRSKLRQAAGVLGSAGRDLFISVLASVLARSTGIG